MRRIGDLMSDLGFNKDAPLEAQKAFIRHLVRAAGGTVGNPEPLKSGAIERPSVPGEQLSFDPEILGAPIHKKTSGIP